MAAEAIHARSTGLNDLLNAANDAAKREATQYFFLVTLMVSLAVAVGGTTHRKLLLESRSASQSSTWPCRSRASTSSRLRSSSCCISMCSRRYA